MMEQSSSLRSLYNQLSQFLAVSGLDQSPAVSPQSLVLQVQSLHCNVHYNTTVWFRLLD